jgi:hypothetical protein
MNNDAVIEVSGVSAKLFREDSSTPAEGEGEWYGEGTWKGVGVRLTLQRIAAKDYWLAAFESDNSAHASRNFRVTARGREPEEAIEILRSIVDGNRE